MPFFADGDSDVCILLENIPMVGPHQMREKGDPEIVYITPEEYILSVPGMAVFYAGYGKKISLQLCSGVMDIDVRLFCLSNLFAALLQQRRQIPLHCSSVLHEKGLVLIFGQSGSGKSTTLMSLRKRGYAVFSDDVCVPILSGDKHNLMLFSSYPMLKLWKTTADYFGMDPLSNGVRLRAGLDKFGFYFHGLFCIQPMRPFLCFFLDDTHDKLLPSVEKISGADLFLRLDKNTYRGEYLMYSNLMEEHFKTITSLAKSVDAYLVKRKAEADSIEAVADCIAQVLKNY